MPASSTAKLYSTELLSLATELASYPFDGTLPLQGEVRSRTCGSTLKITAGCDEAGRLQTLGLSVTACAVGQAAATIFARSAKGCGLTEIERRFAEIEEWLSNEGAPLPQWPGFAALAPARDHKGRHGALVMPWKAGIEVLSKA